MCLLALFTAGCGDAPAPGDVPGGPGGSEPVPDNTEAVLAYYAARPDFFTFKTPADLPTGLNWQDGAHLPEIGSPEARKGGTEYVRIQDFPRTLRTAGPDSNGSFRPWILDFTTLALGHRHPEAFEYYPGLAEAWAVSPEDRTVYVRLDKTATFSDGVPITADDYLFTFFFYQSEDIVAPWYNNWYGTQYTNITRYDDHTISVTIPEAKPDMDGRVLGLRPVPRHFYREMGDDFVERYQWRFAPTTGPYVIQEKDIRKSRSIALTRNDAWWAKDKQFFRNRYNPDRIVFTVIRDTPKEFEAFKRGDLDQFRLDLAEYWYEKLGDEDPDVQAGYIHKSVFYNQRPRPTYGLWINTSRPLLDDINVRVGIQHATNWQLVIDSYFRGDYDRLRTSNDGFGEFSHPDLVAREYDVDLALDAFAKAGFAKRGPDGILVNNAGDRLAFTLSTGYEDRKDILTILKQEAAKAGVDFRLEVLDGTAGWKKVQEKKHDLHFSAFAAFLEMYPRYWETFHSVNAYDQAFLDDGSVNPERKVKTQTNNLELLALAEMDALIDRYRASGDKDEMIELAHRMDELHYEHASWVPGYVQPHYRIGHWRWVRYPEGFNHKHSRSAGEFFVHWLDPEAKGATRTARSDGVTFPASIRTFDQHR
ncbi:MAG: ABC transporter substrate-binding protein [Gammaproteobacteria bacterium]|nr:ABC transporter substrate-binding protein [Gammaproteobacteria bacterium]